MPSKRLRKIGIVVLIAFISVIFTTGMNILLTTLSVHVPGPLDKLNKTPEGKKFVQSALELLQSHFWLVCFVSFIFVVIITPIIEEFLFRWIPLRLAKRFIKNRLIFWSIVVGISVIGFGYIHGGWPNIFIQGVVGLILVIIFLRFGYWYAVLTHAIYNGFCIVPLLILILVSGYSITPPDFQPSNIQNVQRIRLIPISETDLLQRIQTWTGEDAFEPGTQFSLSWELYYRTKKVIDDEELWDTEIISLSKDPQFLADGSIIVEFYRPENLILEEEKQKLTLMKIAKLEKYSDSGPVASGISLPITKIEKALN